MFILMSIHEDDGRVFAEIQGTAMKRSTTATPIPKKQTTVQSANEVLSGKSKKGFFARLLPFMGPAFIASVAYMDPGNFATNIQGGAKFGYMLLWVILASNLMAMLLQSLSARTWPNIAATSSPAPL
jgi:hypothetical protein